MMLFDTARRELVPFEPGDLVKIYTCGITPYDATHLGHAAAYMGYDILQRRLRDLGHETRCVRNVTDVDDDLLRKAREVGMHYLDLAAKETARFDNDMIALEMIPSFSEPRATSAISEIRSLIDILLEKDHAYVVDGWVYFDVSTWDKFGSISGYDEATMLKLHAERGGNNEDPKKRNPLDFVLWQPSGPGEPSWEAMWGAGRPGWHVECSALVFRELGETIDLHGGGSDLIFPHHEGEAAQAEAATGKPFVRHWMHQAMVRMDGEKMSKSLGNLVFVDELRKTYDPRTIRLAIVAHHYREEWEWNEQLMPDAVARLEAWTKWASNAEAEPGSGQTGSGENVLEDPVLEQVRAALDNDLDTPGAVAAIDAAAAAGQDITKAAMLLGVRV